MRSVLLVGAGLPSSRSARIAVRRGQKPLFARWSRCLYQVYFETRTSPSVQIARGSILLTLWDAGLCARLAIRRSPTPNELCAEPHAGAS